MDLIEADDLEGLRVFLGEGGDPNTIDTFETQEDVMESVSLLTAALAVGNEAMAALLLSKGADPLLRDDIGTPFRMAVERAMPNIVRQMLTNERVREVIDETETRYIPPLVDAIMSQSPDVVELLVQNGANVELPGDSGERPIQFALNYLLEDLSNQDFRAIVRILLKAGAELSDEEIQALPQAEREAILRERAAAKRGPMLGLRYHGDNPQGGRKSRKTRSSRKGKSRKTRRIVSRR